jgi:predicted permease
MIRLVRRLDSLFRRGQHDAVLDEELQAHLHLAVEDLVADGWSREAAEREARLRLGNARAWRESAVDAWGWRWLHDVTGDLRVATRSLLRQPLFTATSTVSLALGLGANAAVFALAWHTSFGPLPFPDSPRLIRIFESNVGSGRPLTEVSPASTVAWATESTTIDALGIFGGSHLIFPEDDNGEPARYQSLSPGVLAALGTRPILGRIVLTDAERQPDEVLISYEYWQRRFGGDPGVINRLHHFADVASVPDRIIGVMPPGFRFLEPADIWAINPNPRPPIGRGYRSSRQNSVLARVRAGHTIAEATAEIARISENLARDFPDTHAGWTPVVRSLHETVVGDFSTVALLMVTAAGTVFLIGCANVAGLLLMRSISRRRELDMRHALGASRWRIVRLWLCEGVMIATASLTIGLTAASWVINGLSALAPASLPRIDEVTLSPPALLIGVVGFVGIVAVYALAPTLSPFMWSRAGSSGGWSRAVTPSTRGRNVLLAAQASFATVLFAGTVLFTAALLRLNAEPLGFDPSGVLSARIHASFAPNRRPWSEAAEYGRQLEEQVRSQPGVVAAALATAVPFEAPYEPLVYRVDGDPTDTRWNIVAEAASTGYLATLGLTLVEGHWFADQDAFTPEQLTNRSKPGADYSGVVTEATARALWPRESALNKRLIGGGLGAPIRIVGVVRDLKLAGADEVPVFRLFLPWRQVKCRRPARLSCLPRRQKRRPRLQRTSPSSPGHCALVRAFNVG